MKTKVKTLEKFDHWRIALFEGQMSSKIVLECLYCNRINYTHKEITLHMHPYSSKFTCPNPQPNASPEILKKFKFFIFMEKL